MESGDETVIAGADGCRGGWVVATRHDISVEKTLQRRAEAVDVLGVDMPVGLPPSWVRAADAAARTFLGPRRSSSVFPTVPRALVTASSYAAANAASRERFGRGLSRQSWALVAKMREVDALAGAPRRAVLVEIHPECSFREMTGTVLPAKRTAEGVAARLAAVTSWYTAAVPLRLSGAGADDVLDALAVLWSAERFAAGVHRTLGDGARDERGLPMRIVV